jgi:hypothetical protein
MSQFSLPEGCFPVQAIAPVLANAGAMVGDYISLKNARMCYVVVHMVQATDHPLVITIERATDVAATGSVVITSVVPIWFGNVSTTSTQLTRQTDAVNFTITAALTGASITVFKIDPASLGAFDCITVKISQSAHADNLLSAMYFIQPRYISKMSSMSATEYIVD